MKDTAIEIQHLYPEELKIVDIEETEEKYIVRMKSISRSCVCSACGTESTHVHGTYQRHVQDLPILGKGVELQIRAKEYWCDNPLCSVTTLAETYGNFIGYYGRMTDRLETFICTLALETNCEGCARICKAMNIRTSGDSIIRMILRKYAEQPEPICGSVIGVDDFAFKKRQTYGTIIVDGETHSPIALLEGRDKETLKQWLKHNPHVQTITRDRAGTYASANSESLPGAMQIADRFHLHQNLLEIVQNVLQGTLPANLKIPKEQLDTDITSTETGTEVKKIAEQG